MSEEQLRKSVAGLLRQSHAHIGVDRALADLDSGLVGLSVDGFKHTIWEQVEHLRLAAEDLVSYCVDSDYKELGWPEGYWPRSKSPDSAEQWIRSVRLLQDANETMARLVENDEHDLFSRAPTSDKDHHHTLRAALILLDHNGYHSGQIVALRIALGAWPPPS